MRSEFSLQKRRRRAGIAFRLFLGFILFTAIIVALLWLFQVVFLNSFYKTIKLSSIDRMARQIVLSVDNDDNMLETVRDAVDQEQMNVLVADGRGHRLTVGLSSSNDVFSELHAWELLALYLDTQRSGGSFYQRYAHNGQNTTDDRLGIVTSAESVESVLYVYALQNDLPQEEAM